MGLKLWHDDIRRPPKGWVWARTNDMAISLLEANDFDEISMDHDMGLHLYDPDTPDADRLIGPEGEGSHKCGCALARWMCENRKLPRRIEVHSMNPAGARDIVSIFTTYWKTVEGSVIGRPDGVRWALEGINGDEHVLRIVPYKPKVG